MTDKTKKNAKPAMAKKPDAKKPVAKNPEAKKLAASKPESRKPDAKTSGGKKPNKKNAPKSPPKMLPSLAVNPRQRAGFVAILGAPNAGKSTLLNRLIGQKISITSPKPQTTRMRITGVLTEGDTQIGFVDTPGIFEPKRRLDRAMIQAAWGSIENADTIVLLVDAELSKNDKTAAIVQELRTRNQRVTLVLNKLDAIAKAQLLPLAAAYHDTGIVDDVFMISALNGDGVSDLVKHLSNKMPASPWFFDGEQLSDLPSQLLAAEITREHIFRQLQQELPYGATVVPESWETKRDGSAVIHQTIVVSRANHRPIFLGAGGARIKALGEAARKDIAKMMDQKIHLFLQVKTDEKWQDRPDYYRMFGLEFNKE